MSLDPYHLEHGLAQFFCKCPQGKCFQLRGGVFMATQLCGCSAQAARDDTEMNACGYVLIKLYLQKPDFWFLVQHVRSLEVARPSNM